MTSRDKALTSVAVVLLIAPLPAPPGLLQHAWYFAAVLSGVVTALILQPLPPAAVGLSGVTAASRSIEWVLSGFANSTVWLSFAAFMLAAAYQKTGLGRRIALLLVRSLGGKTLTLGYAVMLADAILAPFTPSNTVPSAGTIYPIIRNLLRSLGRCFGVLATPSPARGRSADAH